MTRIEAIDVRMWANSMVGERMTCGSQTLYEVVAVHEVSGNAAWFELDNGSLVIRQYPGRPRTTARDGTEL